MQADASVTRPTVVMSFRPLTGEFLAKIEKVCGPIDGHYDAANLKNMSILAALLELRRLAVSRLILAIEGEPGDPLLGPLSLAALLTRARWIDVVWSDQRLEPLRRLPIAANIFRVLRDTLYSKRALARAKAAGATLEGETFPRSLAPASGTRVLYLDANISVGSVVGGSLGHINGIIAGLLDHGFTVDYVGPKPLMKRPGVQLLKLEPPTLLSIPPELNYYPYAELIEQRIVDWHRRNPWSFIYQRFSLHNFLGVALGRKLNIPVVLEFNGSEVWTSDNWGKPLALRNEALFAERVAVTHADLIVTVSDSLVRDLRRRSIPDERVLVYPNCVDTEVFDASRFTRSELDALRAQYDIPPDAFVVGFVGTFSQWHGVEFLAACIRELIERDLEWIEKNKIRFLLVGDGPKMPMVRLALGAAPVCKYVSFTGLVTQSDAPKYLACSDLLVSPHVPNADASEFFGSPMKLFEYMAMGKPILASALGQIADVISGTGAIKLGHLPRGAGQECGLSFEPGNAEDFKRSLRRLIEDRALAAALGHAARAEVVARYTWKQHVAAILDRMAGLNLLRRG